MWSSSATLARPVRSPASSLRKSSTAFSIRALACAIASLVVAIVVIQPCLSLTRLLGGGSNKLGSVCADGGADLFAQHNPLDIPRHVQVEHDDGQLVVHAERDRR